MPVKKTVTKRHRRRHTRTSTKKTANNMILTGGAATFDSDSLAAKYASCGSADRHNLQSGEANLNLINGGGVVPVEQTGGADATNGSCPGNAKLLSFKDYTNNVAALLGLPPSVPSPSMQMGGGYSIDPSSEQIGGQPARVGYSDCCPPVSLEGRLLAGANSGAVCGQQAGGKRHRKGKKATKKTLKKSKSKTTQKTLNMAQMGGNSVPAAYPAESHAGADGDFSDHGQQLHYDARQPFWDATAR